MHLERSYRCNSPRTPCTRHCLQHRRRRHSAPECTYPSSTRRRPHKSDHPPCTLPHQPDHPCHPSARRRHPRSRRHPLRRRGRHRRGRHRIPKWCTRPPQPPRKPKLPAYRATRAARLSWQALYHTRSRRARRTPKQFTLGNARNAPAKPAGWRTAARRRPRVRDVADATGCRPGTRRFPWRRRRTSRK